MKEKNFEFEDKKYVVKSPSASASREANRVYSLEFTKCLDQGLMDKKQMINFLESKGVWSKEKQNKEDAYKKKIYDLEVELYRGTPGKKRMTLAEGKAKALEIKKLRNEYISLITDRQEYEANTANAMADNARFDFLVSQCVFTEDGQKVYNSYEEYQQKSDEDLAYTAASTLAQMLYDLEEDFAKKLPENQFLRKFKLVNDDLQLIDKDGNLVDLEGRRINEEGYYIDGDGKRVDKRGNPIGEDGFLEFDVVFTDDDGNDITFDEPEETETETEIEERPESSESN